MIVFIFGTTAEAIKLAPIARRLDEQKIPYQYWLTLQHTAALMEILPGLGFGDPDQMIANTPTGKPLKNYGDVFRWLVQSARWLVFKSRSVRRSLPANTIVIVHGDTMTSVLGAFIAKWLRFDSAHVEAGLRSGNWRHPFPEELDRRIVGKMARVHYSPSDVSTANLGRRPNVVHTHGNTAIDAVLDRPAFETDNTDKFGVVLLHRFELLAKPSLVEDTMKTLASRSPLPFHLFVNEFSEGALTQAIPSADRSKIQVQKKVAHDEFVGFLRNAQFVVTDSGGIQEEAALLGVPTLVHRVATERGEGLGQNVVLSEWKIDRLSDFLANFARYRRPMAVPESSPSDVIVYDLIARGYAR
ncbi:UDP-N-acetylglucosamine 2-epimerase [Cryobacterium sp. N21]|uniref:UDP-N-acetylglucosamine 2-epimerase n=1 Tax=Cryobacterium sp. N21 TaxID=2048289 RepID=UPI000CE34FA3|nr:UDP-N-acetylglucosamine 2-epimerase [Cryobacterium sp. N21]